MLQRWLSNFRTTWVVISPERPRSLSCSYHLTSQCVRCTVRWRYCERTRSVQVVDRAAGQGQLTMQMNDWDKRTSTLLGLTCLWVSFLAKKKKKKNSENGKKKKKEEKNSLRGFGSFVMLSSFPGLPTKSFLKSILHSNKNDNRHEVSVSIRLGQEVISGVRPTDQRRSAGTTFSGSDD